MKPYVPIPKPTAGHGLQLLRRDLRYHSRLRIRRQGRKQFQIYAGHQAHAHLKVASPPQDSQVHCVSSHGGL
jgi:hypothetical protein